MKYSKLLLIIFILIVIGSLINSGVFIYETLVAYFLFAILSSFLIAFAGFILIRRTNFGEIVSLPFILAMIWVVYLLAHAYFINNGFNLRYSYLIICGLVFISASIIYYTVSFNFIYLFRALIFLVLAESIICIAQYYHLIGSNNIYFVVTGSWVNPNVTAMFLAMSFPALWFLIKEDARLWRRISVFVLIIAGGALELLNCRTAIIGAFVATLVVLSNQSFFQSFIKRQSKTLKLTGLVAALALVIPLSFYFYKSKQASAEGRLLIWKVSAQMIKEHPVTGYGYGMFERNYNLFQGLYFKEGIATEKEILNSGHVRMAYNEMLENTIEGGIIGLLFFSGFLVTLILHYSKIREIVGRKKELHSFKRKDIIQTQQHPVRNESCQIIALAGVIAFSVMSLVNFTIQAIPCMVLFLIYGAMIASVPTGRKNTIPKAPFFAKHTSLFYTGTGLMLLLASFIIFFSQLQYSKAHSDLKSAVNKFRNNDFRGALEIYQKLDKKLKRSEGYRKEYAKALIRIKRYVEAIEQLEQAEQITSDPYIFMKKGYCFAKLGNYNKAKECIELARNIEPNRFAPRFSLMNLYLHSEDSTKAIEMANEIIELQPKIPSDEVDFYKKEATKVKGLKL